MLSKEGKTDTITYFSVDLAKHIGVVAAHPFVGHLFTGLKFIEVFSCGSQSSESYFALRLIQRPDLKTVRHSTYNHNIAIQKFACTCCKVSDIHTTINLQITMFLHNDIHK